MLANRTCILSYPLFSSRSILCAAVIGLAGLAVAAPPAAADPKRATPDYDGRGNPEARPPATWRWIPRIILSPLYVVNEYVVRRPLGALVTYAERKHWADSVVELFTFGPKNNDVLAPTALFDFGLLPSVGFFYVGDDNFVTNNQVRFHAATWGPKWITVTAADRYTYDDNKAFLQARLEFKRSEDNLYFGVGPDTTSVSRSRYGLQRAEGSLGYHRKLLNESQMNLTSGVHAIADVAGDCCADPSIDVRIAEGVLPVPPGYGESYTALFEHADITIDSRVPKPFPGTGFFLHGEGTASLELTRERSWVAYSGVLGGSRDLTGHQRVLKVQAAVGFVDPLQGGLVPFNELASPGTALMPGFVAGYMVDRSYAAAQVGYTWPVAVGIDGQTRLSTGNAFGDHLDNFSLQKLRVSADIGLTTSAARDQGFELLVGLGSETFEQGGKITSVRVSFGSRTGF